MSEEKHIGKKKVTIALLILFTVQALLFVINFLLFGLLASEWMILAGGLLFGVLLAYPIIKGNGRAKRVYSGVLAIGFAYCMFLFGAAEVGTWYIKIAIMIAHGWAISLMNFSRDVEAYFELMAPPDPWERMKARKAAEKEKKSLQQ